MEPIFAEGLYPHFWIFFLIYKKYRQGENVNETTTKEMVLMNLVKKGIQELQELTKGEGFGWRRGLFG